MEQTWNDLLFAHWPIAPEMMRPLVPGVLPLDTFGGKCWVAVTPFHMSGIRFRGMPPLPGLSRFPELNVRTYVTVDGKPGVFFFSLDAGSLAAVWGARASYHLPYFHARMKVSEESGQIAYHSRRYQSVEVKPGAAEKIHAEFKGKYRPVAPVQIRQPGTLENWLTERYCLYAVKQGSVFRAEIHHAPWPLQDAEAEIEVNTMALAAGITLPEIPPALHFAKRLEVLIWLPQRIT
jgi:uncharacterized protein YqjF (DUF2071 family)